LRLIAGLEEITEGVIYLDDQPVNDLPPKDRDVAMVFQNYALYPHLSVFDNMGFGLKLRDYSRREIRERVQEAAALLGLTDLLTRKPKALSGGQRQRVALGRAIVRKPKVFLFDEPLSNLDAQLRTQMRAELLRLHRRLGVTMIYVTHDQMEAMTMGDRIVVMHEGRLQQVDTPAQLYRNPANRFVAGFMGAPPMNLLRGTLTAREGRLWFEELAPQSASPDGVWHWPLPAPWDAALASHAGQFVDMGLRAEDVRLDAAAQSPPWGEARVDLVEWWGAERCVHLTLGAQTLTGRGPAEASLRESQRVTWSADPTRLFWFDAADGRRLAAKAAAPSQ
jgi:multiple sugar transport system ATP-binding protein